MSLMSMLMNLMNWSKSSLTVSFGSALERRSSLSRFDESFAMQRIAPHASDDTGHVSAEGELVCCQQSPRCRGRIPSPQN